MTNELKRLAMDGAATERMPLLFVGHGNPLNAIDDNPFSRAWVVTGAALPVPKAILSVSAHWLTRGTRVLSAERPQTIHDFGGFPPEMYRQRYPAPGAPAMAREAQGLTVKHHISLDDEWGFDHGTWSVLMRMFPKADVPVFQLSIDYSRPMEHHYELGEELRRLRQRGVLVIGSGNIVHNLPAVTWQENRPYDWALEFDAAVARWLTEGDHRSIVGFQRLGRTAALAHPTYDHFLPLLTVLGMVEPDETPSFFNASFDMSSVSMRSVLFRRT